MILVTQVVDQANVCINGQIDTLKKIDKGLIVFLGISQNDTENDINKLVNKLIKLRVFPDDKEKMNLDIKSVSGEILLISQFTLLGNVKGNNRPDFSQAADKELALRLFNLFADKLTEANIHTIKGFFGEHMMQQVNLNGPVTIILESDKL